jgi:hypothetical protein
VSSRQQLENDPVTQLVTIPPPSLPTPPESKWRREQQAFRQLLPELLKTHRGRYVALHEGQVVESGDDKLAVAGRAYARFGYVPIYVSLVTDAPAPLVRIPTPRILSPRAPS